MLQTSLYQSFLDFGQLLLLLTTQKDVYASKIMANFELSLIFSDSAELTLVAHKIWLLYLLPVNSWVGGWRVLPPSKY